jgi:hypothetical protein
MWLFEKISKIDKPMANLNKMRRENNQINKTGNKKGAITINIKEIQGIIRYDLENLYSNKLEYLEEMNKFLDAYDYPKLNYIDRIITRNEIERVKSISPKRKVQDLMDS